jgi:hypothetical protein
MQPIVRRSALQCPLLESFWFWKAIGFGKLVVLECYCFGKLSGDPWPRESSKRPCPSRARHVAAAVNLRASESLVPMGGDSTLII